MIQEKIAYTPTKSCNIQILGAKVYICLNYVTKNISYK